MAEKDPGRLVILQKIEEFEKKGLWSRDVEEDPETIPLTPEMVDFGNQKLWSRIKTKYVNSIARNYIKKLIKRHYLIIKDVVGLEENFAPYKNQGGIITCNHFAQFDNLAVYKALEKYIHKRELWKVCREGNFTSTPGFYGKLFRNCNTLPLSSNVKCMRMFMDACKRLLQKNEKILIYAEQGMWWNYRKPRPMENGAFKIAAMNKVPVFPLFITMEDSKEYTDFYGYPVQEYTVHVLEPIFPKEELSVKENCEYLKNKNYESWKNCYEQTYGIPLKYAEEN